MKRVVNSFVMTGCLLLALWVIGLVRFVETLPEPQEPELPTDAIVVLTGGEGRLATGLNLLRETPNSRLFVSGVSDGLTVDGLLQQIGQDEYPVSLRSKITFGHQARTTVQNARETAEWCEKEGIRSIRLVTAAYHMQRSLLEFRPVMPDVQIVPHAVQPASIRLSNWWQYPRTVLLMSREYTKFLIASFAHIFGLTTEGFRP